MLGITIARRRARESKRAEEPESKTGDHTARHPKQECDADIQHSNSSAHVDQIVEGGATTEGVLNPHRAAQWDSRIMRLGLSLTHTERNPLISASCGGNVPVRPLPRRATGEQRPVAHTQT